MTSRREFLKGSTGAVLAASVGREKPAEVLRTRGVVIVPEDLTLTEWPDLAHRAGLTTIALHHGVSPMAVAKAIRSQAGEKFLARCKELGLQVEYELHSMRELLPRELFPGNKDLFRMDDKGGRTPDANLCVHSQRALDLVAENVAMLAHLLRPTTGRYFLWGDDGAPWCRCTHCRDLSDSDQALILENSIVGSLRKGNPKTQLAHLAYANTLSPPTKVKPAHGVFLEFAPINRRYDIAYSQQQAPDQRDGLTLLDANLKVFPRETAQALEYWLDVSRFSKYTRPSSKLPWKREVFLDDVETYRNRGIRNVTTFAAWVDADYRARYGDLNFIQEYGEGLRSGGRP